MAHLKLNIQLLYSKPQYSVDFSYSSVRSLVGMRSLCNLALDRAHLLSIGAEVYFTGSEKSGGRYLIVV